jgi:hypothetical protein
LLLLPLQEVSKSASPAIKVPKNFIFIYSIVFKYLVVGLRSK